MFDPRLDPTGRRVAYVTRPEHCASSRSTAPTAALASARTTDDVTWGVAEFVAAEEMGRDARLLVGTRRLGGSLVARVDESPVQRWHIADPANPEQPAMEIALPGRGHANADVTAGDRRPRRRAASTSRGTATRSPTSPTSAGPTGARRCVVVQTRDQRRLQVLAGRPGHRRDDGRARGHRPDWVEIVARRARAWLADGRLVVASPTATTPAGCWSATSR